jgi:hypothetical protein
MLEMIGFFRWYKQKDGIKMHLKMKRIFIIEHPSVKVRKKIKRII